MFSNNLRKTAAGSLFFATGLALIAGAGSADTLPPSGTVTRIAAGGAEWLIASPDLQEKKAAKDGQVLADIKKLISELDSDNFKVREKATTQLTEIGLPALDALREAAKKGSSPEARERAALIEKTIRTKHRLPTIENGMEFQFKMEVGSATADYVRISFSLKITNTAAMPYQIYARGAVKPVFLDAKGKNLAEKARKMSPKKGPGSGTSNAPLSSPNLWPKGSFDMDFGTYRVLGMPGDSVELSDSWGVSGRPTESMVPPGDYQVGLIYENKLQQEPKAQAGNWLWVGRAVTLTEPLTVKPIAPK